MFLLYKNVRTPLVYANATIDRYSRYAGAAEPKKFQKVQEKNMYQFHEKYKIFMKLTYLIFSRIFFNFLVYYDASPNHYCSPEVKMTVKVQDTNIWGE